MRHSNRKMNEIVESQIATVQSKKEWRRTERKSESRNDGKQRRIREGEGKVEKKAAAPENAISN